MQPNRLTVDFAQPTVEKAKDVMRGAIRLWMRRDVSNEMSERLSEVDSRIADVPDYIA